MFWGAGRISLLGGAIHAAAPDPGQGACQALEDAVAFADSLHRRFSPAAGLRDYEARHRRRANFVVGQSRRLGTVLQLANPLGVWLRQVIGSTSWAQKRAERLLPCVDLLELVG